MMKMPEESDTSWHGFRVLVTSLPNSILDLSDLNATHACMVLVEQKDEACSHSGTDTDTDTDTDTLYLYHRIIHVRE